jgi:hypothetical protein
MSLFLACKGLLRRVLLKNNQRPVIEKAAGNNAINSQTNLKPVPKKLPI